MKETKEMMKILSENKKREQARDRQLKEAKERAKDVTGVIWLYVVGIVIFTLIAQL